MGGVGDGVGEALVTTVAIFLIGVDAGATLAEVHPPNSNAVKASVLTLNKLWQFIVSFSLLRHARLCKAECRLTLGSRNWRHNYEVSGLYFFYSA